MNIRFEYSKPLRSYGTIDPCFIISLKEHMPIDFIKSVKANGCEVKFSFNHNQGDLYLFTFGNITSIEIDYSSIAEERDKKIKSIGI